MPIIICLVIVFFLFPSSANASDYRDYQNLAATYYGSNLFTFNNLLREIFSPFVLPSPTPSATASGYFTVSVADESFCFYSTDSQTIELATGNYYGQNNYHLQGKVEAGNGGFNYGYGGMPGDKYWRYWSWQLNPDTTRMVELSIELCDGLPSAVEYGPIDIGYYCPWLGKVTALGCSHP